MVEEQVLVGIPIYLLKPMVSDSSCMQPSPQIQALCFMDCSMVTKYLTAGKHGHGVLSHDRFEKAYYEKHPELIKKEIDQYHEKPAWAMSSDDLNKIVRDTASRGSALGETFSVLLWKSLKCSFLNLPIPSILRS